MTAPRPFQLTPPLIYEDDIHVTFAKVLDVILPPEAVWFHYPAGHTELPAGIAARLYRFGLKRSLPDFWILYHGVFCIEMKRPGGKLSRTVIKRTPRGAPRELIGQQDMFPKLLRTGAIAAIGTTESVDEAEALLVRWGIPLRGRIAA